MTGRPTLPAIDRTWLGPLERPARPGGAAFVASLAFAKLIGDSGLRCISDDLLR